MPVQNGFDVKLDKVDGEGLPRNRSLWCFEMTVPKGKHMKLCLDFKGNLSVSDPGNFDDKKASDHDKFKWGGKSTRKTDPKKGESPENTTTDICFDSSEKKGTELDDSTKIKLCFVGPADGAVGDVSVHSISRVRVPGTRNWEWQKLDHGQKGGMETPLALGDGAGGKPLVAMASEEPAGDADFGDDLLASLEPQAFDRIDMDEFVEDDTAGLELVDIGEAAIGQVKGLSKEDEKRLIEMTGAKTLSDVLDHELFRRLCRLKDVI